MWNNNSKLPFNKFMFCKKNKKKPIMIKKYGSQNKNIIK